MEYIADSFIMAYTELMMSENSANAMWNFICASLVDKYPNMKSFATIKRKFYENIPTTTIDYQLLEKASGELITICDKKSFPRKKYPSKDYEILSEWTKLTIKEVYIFHSMNHGKKVEDITICNVRYDVSFDGVPVTESGLDKSTVLCVRFHGCKLVYNVGLHKYRYKLTMK